jgi:HEAT repeat protein
LQRVCAWALVTLEPDNPEYVAQALPRLTAGLSDEMPLVRKECAIAIRAIGPEAKAAVGALVEALDSSEAEVQAEILDALAHIGPAAKSAIPRVLVCHFCAPCARVFRLPEASRGNAVGLLC